MTALIAAGPITALLLAGLAHTLVVARRHRLADERAAEAALPRCIACRAPLRQPSQQARGTCAACDDAHRQGVYTWQW